MATINRKTYTTALTSALTTELNALASANGSAASSAIDNSTNLDLFMDLVLDVTYGTNPTASSTVDVYLLPSIDGGTGYADYTSGATPFGAKAMYVGSFELRAVTSAQKVILTGIGGPNGAPLPEKFKLAVINNAGQAMAATSNTLKYRTYSMTVA